MPVIGFMHSGSADAFASQVSAFQQGLKDSGYVEGQNVAIEYRWADGRSDRLATLAADLVRRQVAVIAAFGGNNPTLAARAATGSTSFSTPVPTPSDRVWFQVLAGQVETSRV
jgi:putative ABC transport system substrate-binding protein